MIIASIVIQATMSPMSCMQMLTGPPLSPHPQLHVRTITELVVSWNEPFTWDPFPIIDYNVTVYNTSEVEYESLVVTEIVTEYSKVLTLDHMATTCSLLRFEITARNEIGTSMKGTISGGFPVGKFTSYSTQAEYAH